MKTFSVGYAINYQESARPVADTEVAGEGIKKGEGI